MKKSFLHTALSLFLLTALLVGQVAVNFFHHHHSAEQSKLTSLKKANPDASYLSDADASEDCKICSLDIIHDFFYSETVSYSFTQSFEEVYQKCFISYEGLITSFHQGRAPPVL